MAKKNAAALSLRDLSRAQLEESDWDEFRLELASGTDRASALVASAVLDHELAKLLELVLIHRNKEQLSDLLYGPNAPLSSFSARLRIMHAIGAISDDVRASADIVRNVRNAFAHAQKPLKFTHATVESECMRLPATHAEDDFPWEGTPSPPRRRYVGYCLTLSLIVRIEMPKQWGNRPHLWAVARERPAQKSD